MKYRAAMAFAFVALSGCESPAPAPPNPTVVALHRSCQAGDTGACGILLQAEQAEYQRRVALAGALRQGMAQSAWTPAQIYIPSPAAPYPAAGPRILPPAPSVMPGARVVNCHPTNYGGMSCVGP